MRFLFVLLISSKGKKESKIGYWLCDVMWCAKIRQERAKCLSGYKRTPTDLLRKILKRTKKNLYDIFLNRKRYSKHDDCACVRFHFSRKLSNIKFSNAKIKFKKPEKRKKIAIKKYVIFVRVSYVCYPFSNMIPHEFGCNCLFIRFRFIQDKVLVAEKLKNEWNHRFIIFFIAMTVCAGAIANVVELFWRENSISPTNKIKFHFIAFLAFRTNRMVLRFWFLH